jgi:aspartate-semialdehyde dehydrogenase
LGTEVAQALHERGFPLASLRPVASESSLGTEVTVQGVSYPVESGAPNLRGIDLAFLCAPPSVSLDWVEEALRARVPTFEMSGALAARDEVPLGVTSLHPAKDFLESPIVATPAGPSLGWLRALLPLHGLAPIERVVATTLESVSAAGRLGAIGRTL